MILINYFISVQFYGVLLAIAKAVLLFVDGYYYKLSLFGVLDVLCVGQLYKERILAEQLVVDVDYAYRIHTYFFGLVKVQKILNRDGAIKAKWITIRGDAAAGEAYDIEMKRVGSSNDDETVISVQMNPLIEDVTQRSSVVFSMDGIFGAGNHDDDEEVGGYNNIYSSSSSNNSSNVATENPIHSLASMLDTVSLRPVTTRQESLQRQPSGSRINSETEAAAAVVEDDAALYLEYQNLQDNHDDALYDLNDDSDVAMSFEEWKSRRKQFKQGTRGSFLRYLTRSLTHFTTYLLTYLLTYSKRAFQVFEEREQIVRDNLEASASVKNTMKLHSNKVKNVLSATSVTSKVLPR